MPTNSEMPTVDAVLPLARRIARRIARRPDDIDDLIQAGLLAYHLDRARQTAASPARPWCLVRQTLRRAMLRQYRGAMIRARHVELTDSLIATREGQLDLRLMLDDYYATVERRLGATARAVAASLVEPTTACGIVMETARRSARPPRRFRFSHVVARRALGLSAKAWLTQLTAIRSVTREYLAVTGSIRA